MVPRIVSKPAIKLVGAEFYGNPFEKAGGWSEQNAIGQLWARFSRFYDSRKSELIHLVGESGYEVWIDTHGDSESKAENIFVGVEVSSLEDIPVELVGKVLPASRYAVFTLTGEQIRSNWGQLIFAEWLPAAGLTPVQTFLIELYDAERFKGINNPASELDILVPLE